MYSKLFSKKYCASSKDPFGGSENKIEANYSIRKLRSLQNKFPNLNIIVGASTAKMFGNGERKTATARQHEIENIFYD